MTTEFYNFGIIQFFKIFYNFILLSTYKIHVKHRAVYLRKKMITYYKTLTTCEWGQCIDCGLINSICLTVNCKYLIIEIMIRMKHVYCLQCTYSLTI